MKIKKILFINFTEDTNINRGVGYISGVILAAKLEMWNIHISPGLMYSRFHFVVSSSIKFINMIFHGKN